MEYLIYPIKNLRITQNYNGRNNHYKHSTGNPKDYPFDDGGKDGGAEWIYAPCKVKVVRIYGVGSTGLNTIWLTSTDKVMLANGKQDYITLMVEHCTDASLKKVKVGQTFKQKQAICKEGKDGATANHFHISVGRGKISGNGWKKNNNGAYVLTTTNGALYPQNAFYIDPSFTTILNKGGMAFKSLPIKNANIKEEGDFMAKAWKNGVSREPVYQTTSNCKQKKQAIGYLEAKENATCVAIIDDCYLIMYSASGGTKCGFVAYSGGVK